MSSEDKMSNADKTTIKIRAYADKTAGDAAQSNLSEEQHKALELVKMNAQLEQEKKKTLELQATIEQLRASLKQEQEKVSEMTTMAKNMEGKLKELAELEAKAKQVAVLEAKVNELSEVLGKISGIASSGNVA